MTQKNSQNPKDDSLPSVSGHELRAETRKLSFWYKTTQALMEVTLPIADRKVTALIGPSGCGKARSFAHLTGCMTCIPAIGIKEKSGSFPKTAI